MVDDLTEAKNVDVDQIEEEWENGEENGNVENKKKWLEDKLKQLDEGEYNVTIFDIFPKDELTPAGSGTYKMICPDCDLQGGRTEGFIIFPPDATGPGRAFCHSSHKNFRLLEAYALKKKIIRCLDGRDSGDSKAKVLGGELYKETLDVFKDEFGLDKFNQLCDQLKIKKEIELPGNNRYLNEFASEMGDIYKSRNIIFRKGDSGQLVQIEKIETIDATGETKVLEKGFAKVEGDSFISAAEMFVSPWTNIMTKMGTMIKVKRSMTQTNANQTLASDDFKRKLPIIMRIFGIQIPVLRGKEIIFPKRGYDKRIGSWLPYNAPMIKKDMFSLEDAINVIKEVFSEFCFASEADRTRAIAGFLTPFCRGLFEDFTTRTPIFVYMANRERAGKDYCAGCSGMLYEGVHIQEAPICTGEEGSMGNSNEELRKKLTACMQQGRKRFHSSNNKGMINNSVLENVTTNQTWSDRTLGKTHMVAYDNEIDYSLSGNIGMTMTPDLINRSRIVNLHMVEQNANERVFKNPNLHEWIKEHKNRIALISAMWKLVETWYEKGMKPGSVPFTSYPKWAAIVGGIMEACGLDNPCKEDDANSNVLGVSIDPETKEMEDLFVYCYNNYPGQWMSKEELVDIVEREKLMPGKDLKNNNSHQISFGIKLNLFVKRQLGKSATLPDGIIMEVDSTTKQARYRKYRFICKNNNQTTLTTPTNNNATLPNFGPEKVDSEKITTAGSAGTAGLYSSSIIPIGKLHTIDTTLLSLPTLLSKELEIAEKQKQLLEQQKQLPINEQKELPKFSTRLAATSSIAEEYLKKEADAAAGRSAPREKTDRELQYWEAPECENIVPECTKEQVYNWVKANPRAPHADLRIACGLGSGRFVGELIEEGKVKICEDGNWEVVNGEL